MVPEYVNIVENVDRVVLDKIALHNHKIRLITTYYELYA